MTVIIIIIDQIFISITITHADTLFVVVGGGGGGFFVCFVLFF